jgi:hypothetical protein
MNMIFDFYLTQLTMFLLFYFLYFDYPLLYQLIISGTFFEIQNIEYIKHTFFF